MLLVGRYRMASTLSHSQSIPIALDWADLELAQEHVTTHNCLVHCSFHLLQESSFGWRNVLNSRRRLGEEQLARLINSAQGTRPIVHDDDNLSISVMLLGSTSSGCEVVNAPVTAGQTVHADQAHFFPLPRKLDTVFFTTILIIFAHICSTIYVSLLPCAFRQQAARVVGLSSMLLPEEKHMMYSFL